MPLSEMGKTVGGTGLEGKIQNSGYHSVFEKPVTHQEEVPNRERGECVFRAQGREIIWRVINMFETIRLDEIIGGGVNIKKRACLRIEPPGTPILRSRGEGSASKEH